jgi:hypothetical protein
LIAVNFPPLDRGTLPPFSMRMSNGTMKEGVPPNPAEIDRPALVELRVKSIFSSFAPGAICTGSPAFIACVPG